MPQMAKAKTEEKATTQAQSLGYEDFLTLFVTSLQYQDPTTPMDNAEMMNQMSQIGFMQAVAEMKDTIGELKETIEDNKLQQGASLLGMNITALDEEGKIISGIAEKVGVSDGTLNLLVDEKVVQIGSVLNVGLLTEKE